eukprot:136146-Rhodomonas_salina.3
MRIGEAMSGHRLGRADRPRMPDDMSVRAVEQLGQHDTGHPRSLVGGILSKSRGGRGGTAKGAWQLGGSLESSGTA